MKQERVRHRLLIVEDDCRLRELLERYLGQQGFEVRGTANAAHMWRLLQREHFDLLILDLMLPDGDGLALCRELRGQSNTIPVLILTAKGEDVDRIIGLEMGADDYLPKPCNPRELAARVRAILRRRPRDDVIAPDRKQRIVEFGPNHLDLGTRLLERHGESHTLTTGEFGLLRVLVMHPHEPMSRDRLLTLTRDRDREPFDRSVDVMISRLRRLVEDDPAKPRYIQTVWGLGYVFVPDGQAR